MPIKKKKNLKVYCASAKDRYYYGMGKGRRKSTTNKLKNISNRAAKSSEIAPNFKKNSENEFQDALARKDFDKAKSILGKMEKLRRMEKIKS